jgi:hypothetical protein
VNQITVGGTANIVGTISMGTGTFQNDGGNYTILNGVNSNLTLYADGSALQRGGIVCSTTQISSNVFTGDSTISHINNHNSTGYALTQSSSGLTTINATTGNSGDSLLMEVLPQK